MFFAFQDVAARQSDVAVSETEKGVKRAYMYANCSVTGESHSA